MSEGHALEIPKDLWKTIVFYEIYSGAKVLGVINFNMKYQRWLVKVFTA